MPTGFRSGVHIMFPSFNNNLAAHSANPLAWPLAYASVNIGLAPGAERNVRRVGHQGPVVRTCKRLCNGGVTSAQPLTS
jgi:hypothetical protein